ncbi:MAG TPA: NYN domain-containing protein, partial [Ktedonobacteraceae bacterium]|nr:NYN domain-containing protein [Ktedonobacteraceae bacterium]
SYPEHNDVDTSVVEDTHAPETTTSSPSAIVTASTGEETPEQSTTQDVQFAGGQTPQALTVTEAQEGPTSPPEHGEQDNATSSVDATNEEKVKTFTAFIEEFRQAEARFGRGVQEAQEAQEGTTTPAPATPTAPSAPTSSVEEMFVPEFAMPWETPHIASTPTTEPTEETTLTTEPTTSVEVSETEETTPATRTAGIAEAETPETPAPAARPVSPLLRPASRMRLPRHNTRHREETRAPAADVTAQPDQPEQAEPQAAQPTLNEATAEPTVKPVETTSAEAQPRPARRYRFDNLSKTAPAATTAPAPTTDTGLTNGHSQTAQPTERESQSQVKPTPTIAQPEQTVAKQTSAEPVIAENTATQPQVAAEPERRRKHGQERQRGKEQVTPQAQAQQSQQPQQSPQPQATVADIASTLNAQQVIPAVVEPVTEQKDDVEPEDLPPLEYSELQKANTRRRRRRHTNGVSVATLTGNALPATPEIPATTPGAPVAQPRSIATPPPTMPQRPVVTPSTPAPQRPSAASAATPQRPAATPPSVTTNQAPFTITSGYTVSQMNQGNDNVGPFMGPDPSPARGTMAAQNVRSIRTDAQRTPAYPVRTTEATSASVNQLANIVSQAIQTQTDRMVAELRRANQAPTNISVSMPPFPSNERVGVFVDVANLLYSARTLRMAVDFGKLLDFLRGNRRLIRAHAYCPTSPQPGDEQMFLQAVKGLGYRITTKNYKTFSSGAKKADLDLDLCMDVVRLVDGKAVDCIVLVSGDSDFMPMLDYCSDHGVRVEVAAFDEAMSGTLRQSCDLFINLSMLDEIRA